MEETKSGMQEVVQALYSPSPSKEQENITPTTAGPFVTGNVTPASGGGINGLQLSGSPVPAGMDAGFYTQDFSKIEAARVVTEIEGRQAGDPHGTTAAYRHLVKVLVKRLGTTPDSLSIKTAEKRQVERALDNARLEVESQQNTINHLKQELTERREHERLNQHSIALLDAKLGEKVREALFTSNELDALRRHNQALVDTKTGIDSQLETCKARLVERNGYIIELEAKVEDLGLKLSAERRERMEEATTALQEHTSDQESIRELTKQVDAMRKGLSETQDQLKAWEVADSTPVSLGGVGDDPSVSTQLRKLVESAQRKEKAALEATFKAQEAAAIAKAENPSPKPSLKTLVLLAAVSWPVLITFLVAIAAAAYGGRTSAIIGPDYHQQSHFHEEPFSGFTGANPITDEDTSANDDDVADLLSSYKSGRKSVTVEDDEEEETEPKLPPMDAEDEDDVAMEVENEVGDEEEEEEPELPSIDEEEPDLQNAEEAEDEPELP